MRRYLSGSGSALRVLAVTLLVLGFSPAARASIAYGTLNNFDCVNDTGVEAHGFEIELDDIHSTDITYTYDYNHYGIPKITEDSSDPAHPKVFIRYAATRLADGTWSAYTAIPAGPITPTDGHQFTNPSVNFGGEHFGAGYYGAPTAVKYNWLIDDGAGNLIHGPPVNVSTPTFTYNAPALQVIPVIAPPPPPAPPPKQFGAATWVKDIKTTTHNPGKVALNQLVDPDPDNPAAPDWTNGEPAEVETEWRILQTKTDDPANPNNELAGAPEELPNGDEVITRRYEFYEYIGPYDAESNEAKADVVGALAPDGIHYYGDGTVTYNDHMENGEWVTVTVDLSTVEVVGDFSGAQMAAFDVAPALGLIDHIPGGELGVAYADRTVVVAGGAAFSSTWTGSLPDGTTLDTLTGVFSGTPTAAGVFTFTVDAWDTTGAFVSREYTVTIPDIAPVTSRIETRAQPIAGGTTAGDGTFDNGTQVTVVATHSPDYKFVNWTEGGVEVSASAVYPFTVSVDRKLVANFAPSFTITTTASPIAGGSTSGDGAFDSGDSVTVKATANVGYAFVDWTEGGVQVSTSTSYTFSAGASRTLVANFVPIYTIATSALPVEGGSTSGGGTFNSGASVTVTASPNAGYSFLDWTEGSTEVSTSALYSFTAGANRNLVANFVPIYAVTTSASPAAGGTTSGDGTFTSGASVTVTATPGVGYKFINWTESGIPVSTAASYTFTATANRALVANFALKVVNLHVLSATAIRSGSKIVVTVTVKNFGDETAPAVTIVAKKDALLQGKTTSDRVPVFFGDLFPDHVSTRSLAFSAVKAGSRTLQLRLTYTGGVASLSEPVLVP